MDNTFHVQLVIIIIIIVIVIIIVIIIVIVIVIIIIIITGNQTVNKPKLIKINSPIIGVSH